MGERHDERPGTSPEQDLLAAVMNTSVAAITVLSPRGQIVFANDQAERILGLHREDLLERRYDAPAWKATAIDGGPWPDEKQPFTIVMKTGAPVYDIRHAIEWPNGQRKILSVNGAPIRNEGGEIVSLVFSITDVTRSIRTEQMLQRIVESTAATGRAYLESIVRALAESLHVRYAQVAELIRGSHERVRTVAVWANGALADDFEYDLAGTPCEGVVSHGICFHREGVVSKFPGDDMLREMNAECYLGVPLLSSSGEVLGLLAVLDGAPLDETLQPEAILRVFAGKVAAELQRKRAEDERRALEERLFQAQKMESVGRLAGGVAHDFNNLLTAILCFAELGLERPPGAAALADDLRQILAAASRGARLTGQLLAFARKQVIAPAVLDLNGLVTESLDMLRRLLGEDVEVVWIPAPGLGCVKADRGQLEQILMNLAVNARDAMPEGGRLTIETGEVALSSEYAGRRVEVAPGDYVLLAVTDSGTGIPPEEQPKIFEPFYTTKATGKGTGLGLATCYGIVKQHDGHIAVYSEPGKGTTFRVYLPRVREQAAPAERRADPPPSTTGRETLLVVEDYAPLRSMAHDILRSLGYHVLVASDGRAALHAARAHDGPIHLLVTDVVMPRMGGKELAAALCAERPGLRVLYSSGYTENAVVHHGVLQAGVAFLQKPYRLADLAEKIRAVLDEPARPPG